MFDMADLTKKVLARPFKGVELANIENGEINTNLARLIGYKATLAKWDTKQINDFRAWLMQLDTTQSLAKSFIEGTQQASVMASRSTNSEFRHSPKGKLEATISRTFIMRSSQVSELRFG